MKIKTLGKKKLLIKELIKMCKKVYVDKNRLIHN
jgi:hypothetical protein